MVAATLLTIPVLAAGISVRGLFLILGIANLLASIYIIRLLPHEILAQCSAQPVPPFLSR